MDEADLAVLSFSCTYERMEVALCAPAVYYFPMFFFTRYPQETTKVWNLLNLLSPTSWIWTLSAILAIIIMLKCYTFIGSYLGCKSSVQEITLVPFQ